jgi:hypothetical protein
MCDKRTEKMHVGEGARQPLGLLRLCWAGSPCYTAHYALSVQGIVGEILTQAKAHPRKLSQGVRQCGNGCAATQNARYPLYDLIPLNLPRWRKGRLNANHHALYQNLQAGEVIEVHFLFCQPHKPFRDHIEKSDPEEKERIVTLWNRTYHAGTICRPS